MKSNLALYLNNLGISLYYLKEYKEAYEAFSKALELRKKLYEESVSPRAESEYLDTLNNVKVVKRELDKLN